MTPRIATLLAGLALALSTQLTLLAPVAAVDTTGGLAVTTVDPAGTLIVGTCFELYPDLGSGKLGPVVPGSLRCDQPVRSGEKPGPSDGSMDGTTGWSGIAPGAYVLRETLGPALDGTAAAYERAADTPLTVAAGQVGSLQLVHRPIAGFTIHVVDAGGRPLPGSCISLTSSGASTRVVQICDGPTPNATSDAAADGLFVLTSMATSGKPTAYVLKVEIAPPGYPAGATQTVTADPTKPTELTITNTLGSNGGIVLSTVDPTATPLVGGCWELHADAGGGALGALVTNGKRCDIASDRFPANDGVMDGRIPWTGVAPGAYVLHEVVGVTTPGGTGGYEIVPDTQVSVSGGAVTARRLVFRPAPGLVVHFVDGSGAALTGACTLLTSSGDAARRIRMCDGTVVGTESDGDADGLLVLTDLTTLGKPATYQLEEIVAPAGYPAQPVQSVTIDGTKPTELTIGHRLFGNGGLSVTSVDPAGALIAGTCFELYADSGGGQRGELIAASQRCDQQRAAGEKGTVNDDLPDGVAAWTNLKKGSYVVHETVAPGFGGSIALYALAADAPVTITGDTVTSARLVHRPAWGVTVHKVNGAGQPLAGACFSVLSEGDAAATVSLCDGPRPAGADPPGDAAADGTIVFTELSNGRPTPFTLREIVPPPGYATALDQRFEVNEKHPTELRVIDTIDAPSAAPAPSGGPSGPTEVTGLDLEMTSTITITRFTYPTTGTSKATATIPLEQQPDGTWRAKGTVQAVTSTKAGSCPTIAITGSATYAWQVLDVHAGADVAPGDMTLHMDSGPTGDAQDSMTIDACAFKDDSPIDTWPALFFNAYSEKRSGLGFLVDGWKIIDANAWKVGGPVAEATWTGACASPLYECKDTTTFRLLVRAGPAQPAVTGEPAPGASGGTGGPAASPGATFASDGGLTGGPAPTCTDLNSCFSQYWIFGLVGGVAILGGGLLVLRRLTGRAPALTEPMLDANKTGPDGLSLQTDTLGKLDPTLDADKFGTLDADKFGAVEPDTIGGPIKFDSGQLGSLEPPSTDLPPPPG
ncbi:MAG TPA: hypothetical protein VJ850_01310 [Candidatus Limnocylindrales bacterium]|nr:hypothetical protein [Candidatus Limnocylindrales bacterium]